MNFSSPESRSDSLGVQRTLRRIEEYSTVHVAVELPDDIAQQLKTAWQDMPRRVLEAIAVEGYRSGALTRGQVQRGY